MSMEAPSRVSGGIHVPERYLLPGASGALVPGRVAALIYRQVDLGHLRAELRGTDAEAAAVLMALHMAALAWRGSATGTEQPSAAEPAASWLSTKEAAEMLNVTPRAIRKAIDAQRLPAERIGRSWRVSREDVEHYRAAKAA